MFSHRSYSIYGRIVIIVLIPMLLLTCLLLGVYQVFYGMSLEQAKENFTLQTQQYTNSFERRFENIAALAQNVGYSEGVQKYFAQMTSQERVSSYKTVRQFFFHRFQNGAGGTGHLCGQQRWRVYRVRKWEPALLPGEHPEP